MSQKLKDQTKIAALLNKHQTYTKLCRLLLTCWVFCHSNNVLQNISDEKSLKNLIK